jgi:hypothetical protein
MSFSDAPRSNRFPTKLADYREVAPAAYSDLLLAAAFPARSDRTGSRQIAKLEDSRIEDPNARIHDGLFLDCHVKAPSVVRTAAR